jgi:hypothetical protein
MRHLIGLALFATGVALIWAALARRNAIIADLRRLEAAGLPDPRAALHSSLVVIGDVAPPLMIGALIVMALKVVLAYAMTGADRWFSLVDLAGFLFLIGAWCIWLVLKTRYRSFPPQDVQAVAVHAAARPGIVAGSPAQSLAENYR